MKILISTQAPIVFLLFIYISACDSTEDARRPNIIIKNVHLVDIENDRIIENQYIEIIGDSISYAGSMEDYIAGKGLKEIDGEEGYLMPGLWDNHVHFRGGDTMVQENKKLLPLFLAHGITTVRDAGGDITPAVQSWAEQIRAGTLRGPRIFTSGPKLDGPAPAWPGSIKVATVDQVSQAIDSLGKIGADFVKIYDGSLTPEVYYQIIEEAERRSMKVTGHMPMQADLMTAYAAGLDGVEHLYYILKACSPVADSLTQLNIGYGMLPSLIETYDPVLAYSIFKQLASREFFATPTLHIGGVLARVLDIDHASDSLFPYIGERIKMSYQGRIESARRARERGNGGQRVKLERVFMNMVKPMYDQGIVLLAGSDCGPYNSFVYPGRSLHEELEAMVRSGLSPAQALKTSVINGPLFFDLQDEYGNVETGKKADLLILENNPLEDIRNTTTIRYVIQGEQVFDRTMLMEMLEQVRDK
jgi:imidazolonepropionase-like amidohydrolase